ncbi:MAG TPA: hypothetical protein VM869_35745 [Enhygromyxa sp.]|nr:hypothetical protein [Enhygromyxa sp.]
MAVNAQVRPALDSALQQVANIPIAALVSLQTESFTAAGTMSGNKDLALCNASGGGFTLTLPDGANVIVGKPYVVKEWHGTNNVTIDAAGGGTIDGAANLVLAAGEAVELVAREVNSSTLLVTWNIVGQTAPNPAAGGELLAENNLDDVDDAASARSNIGANRKTVNMRVDLNSTNVYRYVNVSGNSETIEGIGSVITGALADGDATITATINGVAVTNGVVTIAESGSAAGTVDSATPTAANVIANGAKLELTIGGPNTAAEFADVSVELSY